MNTTFAAWCFFLIGILNTIPVAAAARNPQEDLLAEAESRLRAIYERNELRPRRLRADWLADSSGYTVLEPDPDGDSRVRVRYDVPSGKRTVLDSPQRTENSEKTSPDGQRVLTSDKAGGPAQGIPAKASQRLVEYLRAIRASGRLFTE